jgi:GNAT superfamily N-acetyltransferase
MHSLVLLAYDAEERVVGGLLGLLQVGWLFIDSLWVDERHRHAGLGTKLLRRTEELALEQGIHRARLNTTSWQARGFYEKAVGLSATGSQAVSRCTAGVTPRPHARAPGGTLEA